MRLKCNLHIVCLAMALMGVYSLLSFSAFNACEVANSNVIFVKDQTQLALDTKDFQVSRYHAFKAINGIWKAKHSFSACGCDGLSTNMELASTNLKEATKALSIEDQRVFLKIAMQNTLIGITAIQGYDKNEETGTVTEKEATKFDDDSDKLIEEEYIKQIDEALSKFEKSLLKVVELDDCQSAYKFLRATQDKTHEKLGKKDLSNRKIYYLTRVVEITNEALTKVNGDCGTMSLTSK